MSKSPENPHPSLGLKPCLKSLYDDPTTAKIASLSFFSKAVRQDLKKLKLFSADMEQQAVKRQKEELSKKRKLA